MSRYVDKKHGLIIGSANIFFYRGEDDVLRDGFRAIVWAKNYDLKQVNTINVSVRTPAQQLLWQYDHMLDKMTLNPYMRMWLKQNVGEFEVAWGVRPVIDRGTDAIFFRRRSGAVKLVKLIERLLEGAPRYNI